MRQQLAQGDFLRRFLELRLILTPTSQNIRRLPLGQNLRHIVVEDQFSLLDVLQGANCRQKLRAGCDPECSVFGYGFDRCWVDGCGPFSIVVQYVSCLRSAVLGRCERLRTYQRHQLRLRLRQRFSGRVQALSPLRTHGPTSCWR